MIKRLSITEMKMLIYNKVKRGMSYENAKKELAKELKIMDQKVKAKSKEKKPKPNFKEEFDKLTKKKMGKE